MGPGTEATLYSGENYSGTPTRIYGDTPVLTEVGNTASIRLSPLVVRLLASRSCVNCNFDGVDLSGLDLTGFDLTGARLIVTNLTNTRLDSAKLEKANLSGATLSCTDFSGADVNHRNDLTSTDFSNIRLVHSNSCRSDFSYTVLRPGSLSSKVLADVNLTGAIIRSVGGSLPPSSATPSLLSQNIVYNVYEPKEGYWAIQPEPAQDPQHRLGRLRLELPFKHYSDIAPNTAPIVADYSSQQMDGLSLFKIPNYNVNYSAGGLGGIWGPPENTFFDWTGNTKKTGVLGIGSNYLTSGPSSATYWIFIDDLGGYHFTLECFDFDNPPSCPTKPFGLKLRVLFRYYPDGTQIGVLQQGEVALFQEQNFKGKAAIFAPGSEPVDLTATNSPTTTIDKSAVSIRVGNNTGLVWTPPGSKNGVALLSGATGDDHRLKEWGLPTGPIMTIPATDVLKGDQYPFDCSGCQMRGVNLSGTADAPLQLANKFLYDADFSKSTFSYVDLSLSTLSTGHFDGATISNVSFVNAQLTRTTFTGATLTCVDFHGADQDHLADLTQAIFTNAQWKKGDKCLNNLSYAKLSIAQIPPSTWSALNLTGAFFVDAAGQVLSSKTQPLHLENSKLAGVSLQGAILDYAVMTDADLTGALLSNCSLQRANLASAQLNGATLVNANLDGANLTGAYLTKPSPNGKGANLEGAFLRNVNLSSSHLSSAKFKNASFYSTEPVGTFTCAIQPSGFTDKCATAARALIEDTEFGGAYLYGTDFHKSTIQGAHFGNSFLAGASFSQAKLSSDSSGTEVGFSGAFLQGTNFGGVELLNGISLAGAFVDFGTPGSSGVSNEIYLRLSGDHTSFPGYWNNPGQPVCVKMTYNNPTIGPPTGPNDTCPNGEIQPSGCGPATPDASNKAWKSPTDITSIASYQANATYTKAPSNGQPFCADDPKWKPFSLSTTLSGKQHVGATAQ